MNQAYRPPMPEQPDEPGWWLASDGLWYPPEALQPAAPAAPVVPTAPQAPAVPVPATGNGFGVAALVIGILAVLGIVGFGIPGIVLGVVALIFGFVGLSVAKSRGAGKGQSVAGIILGAIGIIGGVLFFILIVVAVDKVGVAISKSVSRADPSTYDVREGRCRVDAAGFLSYEGIIRNTSGERKSFTVRVEFDDADGNQIGSGTDIVSGIPPGRGAHWRVVDTSAISETDSVACQVVEVRNFFNALGP